MSPLLSIQNLTIIIGNSTHRVLDQLNFIVKKGQCLGLVGESGSGKSLTALSTLQLLPRMAKVSQYSQITLSGENLLDYSERRMRQIRGGKIGIIFQDAMAAFNPVLTIGEQLIESICLHRTLNRRIAQGYAEQLLAEVGIKNPDYCFHSYPHQLSGGMRQRAMIAMSLTGEPELLIADEPTTALDVTLQVQILTLLAQLKQDRQMGLLFISHDLSIVAKLADEIVVLEKGKKIEENLRRNFFHHPSQPYSQKLLQAILPHQARRKDAPSSAGFLKVDNLRIYFPIRKGLFKRVVGYIKAVDGISFTIAKGETFALVGESGCGKTTTARGIIRLLPIHSGHIIFNGLDLAALSARSLRKQRTNLQIIFQDPYTALDPRRLVGDSLTEGLLEQKKQWVSSQYVDSLLEQVELSAQIKWRYPHELSGGERQRLCIARALALKPQLLILDEPTSALDVSIQKQILMLLEKLQTQLNLSYLLITHDLGVVAYLAHRVAVMQHGLIVEQGDTAMILQNPQHPYTQRLVGSAKNLWSAVADKDF